MVAVPSTSGISVSDLASPSGMPSVQYLLEGSGSSTPPGRESFTRMALRKGSVSTPAWEDDMLSHRVGDLILTSVVGSLGDDLRVRDWGDPGGS
jgi:hypothetical protein